MYALRRKMPKGVAFKTYDGWTYYQGQSKEALDLSDVIRFTKGEAKANQLPKDESFVWIGCYRELE